MAQDDVQDETSPKPPTRFPCVVNYKNVTLSLAADNLAGSGLTLSGSTNFNITTGVAERMLTGQPTSFENDTNFNITLRAQEDEPSYNIERTLTIKILQDPDYYSPAS